MLKAKTSFKYHSETAVKAVKKMIQSDTPLSFTWKEYCLALTIDSSISKTYRLFIKGEKVMIIRQVEDHVEKVTLFVGEVTDENKNPSKRAKEYFNTILASLAEFSDLPQVRVMHERESGVTFVGGVCKGSPKGPFCKHYCDLCVIKPSTKSLHGFKLNFR